MTRIPVWAFCALVVCGSPALGQTAVVSGTLVGHDGKPMARADVHLVRLAVSQQVGIVIRSAMADKAGRFALEVHERGPFFLRFTGVDHSDQQVPLLVDRQFRLNLNVRLATLQYSTDFSRIRVIGAFNEFSSHSGIPMQPGLDSTFFADVPATADTFAYQLASLAGAVANGTESDRFAFDGRRRYISILQRGPGTIRITFDPAKLIRSGAQAEVHFADSNTVQARFAVLADAIGTRRIANNAASRSMDSTRAKANKTRQAADLWTRMIGERDPTLRQILALAILDLANFGAHLAPQEAKRVLTELGSTSPMWVYVPFLINAPGSISNLIAAGARRVEGVRDGDSAVPSALMTEYARFVDSTLAHHSDSSVKAALLYGAGLSAHQAKLLVHVGEYYRRLSSEYPTSWVLPIAKARFSPERNVVRGKPMPDFALVSSEDSTKRVTRQMLQGKVYLVDGWATWCGPCIAEFPILHRLYAKYRDRGFEIVSISFDERADIVTAFRQKRWAMPWVNIWLGPNTESPQAQQFDIGFLPRPILVDRAGMVVGIEVGARGAALERALEQLMAPDSAKLRRP